MIAAHACYTRTLWIILTVPRFPFPHSVGALVVIDRIDREDIGDLLTIVIIAEDGGLPTRNATIQANIKILDINDNTPEFNENLCADIEVSEGVIEGTETGCTVSATDRDSDWGEITYSIQGGNTLQWFQINNKTVSLQCSLIFVCISLANLSFSLPCFNYPVLGGFGFFFGSRK